MGRFVAIDDYDFREILVETDDLMTAYNACLKRIEDTDGECSVDIYDREASDCNPIVGIYGYNEE